VFSLFLDTLIDLVVTHHSDMCDWLHVCLTRLLTKLGADIFGSVHTKVLRALDVVRLVPSSGRQVRGHQPIFVITSQTCDFFG